MKPILITDIFFSISSTPRTRHNVNRKRTGKKDETTVNLEKVSQKEVRMKSTVHNTDGTCTEHKSYYPQ